MKKENIFDVIAISVTIVLAVLGIICYFCRFSINMFDHYCPLKIQDSSLKIL